MGKKLILWTAVTLFCIAASAVEPGGSIRTNTDAMRRISSSGNIKKGKADYRIVFLFDATSPDTVPFLRMLEALNDQYAENEKHIEILAIAKNTPRQVREILEVNGNFNVDVYAEDSRKTFLELAGTEPVMPYTIIADGSGEVLWTGAPADIESVTRQILKKQFSISRQMKVVPLRKALQAAVQSSLPDVILRTADQILELMPGDSIAVQAKLFVYNSSGRRKEALEFIRSVCEKTPEEISLRILYLDYLLRNSTPAELRNELQKISADFQNSPESCFRALAFVLGNAPFGYVPLDLALTLAEKSANHFKDARAEKKALALELLAQIRYMTADINGAVKAQEEAVEFRRNGTFEKEAKERLEYYQLARKLSKS